MLELPMVHEARRQLEICNACRYCEGLCAVFPALERRNVFNPEDMSYLANLCHDCRACYEACPYTPPHELAVDIPRMMSAVRERSYVHYARPSSVSARVDRSFTAGLGLVGTSVLVVVFAVLALVGVDGLFLTRVGPGSFYEVVPWLAMLLPFMALSVAAIGVMGWAGLSFWRDTGRGQSEIGGRRTATVLMRATWDVLMMRNLGGGGPGCAYPHERPSQRRRIYHQLVLYGFGLAFLATVLAAVYQDIFELLPPYDLVAAPVILGIGGGSAMVIGCIGLLSQKSRAPVQRITRPMRTMDLVFMTALLLVNVSGLFLLALRETAIMGLLLAVHLGLTAGLFVAMPYGKFAHLVYRYVALLRNRAELESEEREGAGSLGTQN